MDPTSVYSQLAKALLDTGTWRATKYLSPKLVVKATRRVFGGKIDRRYSRTEIIFTQGAPNFLERKFIKLATEAEERFPIKRILLKDFPARR